MDSGLIEGPTFPGGWRLAPMTLGFIISFLKYTLQPNKYRHFTLKSLRTVRSTKLIAIRRYAKLGKHYYGTTMRIPRWPSPAFDHMVANGGLNIQPELIGRKFQIDSVILALTARCEYHCEHCYASAGNSEHDSVPAERWIETISQLQNLGTSVIVLSGGEPMLRYTDLLTILAAADKRRSDFHLHTSGMGMTRFRAESLKEAGLVAAGVGLDYPDAERHDRFRGHPGAFHNAVQALGLLRRAGVFTYTNVCLQKDLVANGGLRDYMNLAKQLQVGTVQLLEPKPCGRYASTNPDGLFSDVDRRRVMEFFAEANQSEEYRDYPPVAYTAYYERPENFGCLMGGWSHLSVDAAGNVNPCVFVPVSFGNILREDFVSIYRRMRNVISGPIHQGCPSLMLQSSLAEHRRITGRSTASFQEIRTAWERVFTRDSAQP